MEQLAPLFHRILRRAIGIDELPFAPNDRYWLSRSWVAFESEQVVGIVFFGILDPAGLSELMPLIDMVALTPDRPRHLYVDLRYVDGFAPEVFDMRLELFADKRIAIETVVRGAIVSSPGIVGAIARGLRDLSPPPFEEEFFVDGEEAMRWLGCDDARQLVDELDLLRHEAATVGPLLRKLKAMIATKRRLTLREAARSLNHSPRSLQRKLAQAGTSFQEELTLETVKLAQRMLLEPGANVTDVSLEVGCASSQHLSRLFRRVVGETPTGWRDRQRQANFRRAG